MALVKCHECNAEISDTAKACPQCGAKLKKPSGCAAKVAIGLVLLIVVSSAVTKCNAPPEAPKADLSKDPFFQKALAGARALRSSVNNPASFQLEYAFAPGADVLCYRYRATNAFNAVVLQHFVVEGSFTSQDVADWNPRCAGRSGMDYTEQVRAGM